jgi:hypothetical protein
MASLLWRLTPSPHNLLQLQHQHPPWLYLKSIAEPLALAVAAGYFLPLVSLILLILFFVIGQVMTLEFIFLLEWTLFSCISGRYIFIELHKKVIQRPSFLKL